MTDADVEMRDGVRLGYRSRSDHAVASYHLVEMPIRRAVGQRLATR